MIRIVGTILAASALGAVTLTLYYWLVYAGAVRMPGVFIFMAAMHSLFSMPIVAAAGLPLWYLIRRRNLHTSIRACFLMGGCVGLFTMIVLVLVLPHNEDSGPGPKPPPPTSMERLRQIPADLLAAVFVSGSTASLAFRWIQPFGVRGSDRGAPLTS